MTEAEVTVEQIAPGAWRWRCADCDIEGKTDHQREIWAQQWRAIHLKLNHGIIVDWPVDPDRTFGLRLTAQEIDDLTGVIEEWQIEGFAYPEGKGDRIEALRQRLMALLPEDPSRT